MGRLSARHSLPRSRMISVAVLRERVTSKGGTTHAAIASMNESGVKEAIVRAMKAAQARSQELAEEFGKD